MVDVTNFSTKTDFQGSRENLHLAERWRRLDTETLEYIVTIEDATTRGLYLGAWPALSEWRNRPAMMLGRSFL